ncbi:DUF4416 family protein [candidate division WOR-3 bacterium]|nr:DUF4416 family protein [candidate division WOR-3 bacterium]
MEFAAKLVCGIIIAQDCELKEVIKKLEEKFGDIDLESKIIPFDFTDYYNKEMGKGLNRKWVSFEKPIFKEDLGFVKHKTIKIENEFLRTGGARRACLAPACQSEATGRESRRVNLDPGYIDLSRLVLASTKDYSHRIYLGDKVFAEVTLIYKDNHFHPLDWTYPDYRKNIQFFEDVREKFKIQNEKFKT